MKQQTQNYFYQPYCLIFTYPVAVSGQSVPALCKVYFLPVEAVPPLRPGVPEPETDLILCPITENNQNRILSNMYLVYNKSK